MKYNHRNCTLYAKGCEKMEFIKVKISDIGEVIGGSTPSTKKTSNYDGNIAWITPKDLAGYDKVYISRGERNITEEGFKSCSTKMLPKNSVLFSSRAPIGYVAISEIDLCTNQGFKSIVPNDKIDYRFLYYLLKYNKDYIASKGSGSTFKEISGSVMKGIELTIPKDINEQKKIAKILYDIDRKIELNNEINNNLYELSQKIYNRWFIEFEYPVNSTETYKSSGGKFKEIDGKMIPIAFEINNLVNVCDCQNGHAFYKDGYDESGLMVIDLGNVSLQGNFIYTNADKYIQRDRIPNDKFIVKKNDLVMIMTDRKATMDLLGKTAKIYENKEYALNQRIYRIRPTINVNYVYSFLNSASTLSKLKGLALGSVQKYVNTNHINELRILIPSNEIMNEYSKIVDPVFKSMEENILENRNLEQLRDTLLPKLMNGEIDLNKIEI